MHRITRILIMVVVAATVLFSASSCTAPANNEPVIDSLEPDAEQIAPLDSIEVVCTASDPDGDELNYIWSASGGQISGGADVSTWTAPASEGSYNVTVKVIDGLGGEAVESVSISVMTNDAPAIVSLTADAEWITPSGNFQVTCIAADPDGDELSYDWSATGGDVSGAGASVVWSAPEMTGTYNLTVVVTDSYGDSATETIPVSVLTGQPPVIENLVITAEHCYLKPYSGGYYVGKDQVYAIESIVADTSIELFYEWSCTGEGSLISWTAPDAVVDVTVTVTVSDISGSSASEDIVLSVVSCSPCIFGC